MKRSSLLAAGAALAAGASAALLGAAYAVYRTWFRRADQPEVLTTDEWERTVPYGAQMHADAAALAAAPYEPVQITADDGVPLAARYYHHTDGAPVAIIFHGYKGFARRDGMGGYAQSLSGKSEFFLRRGLDAHLRALYTGGGGYSRAHFSYVRGKLRPLRYDCCVYV